MTTGVIAAITFSTAALIVHMGSTIT